jgi:hypothetical protein
MLPAERVGHHKVVTVMAVLLGAAGVETQQRILTGLESR